MNDKTILLEIDDNQVAHITLNRPEVMNALNEEMISELTSNLASLTSNTELRAIVIKGNGDGFCSGLDVSWMEEMRKAKSSDEAKRLAHLLLMIKQSSAPVIAALDGPCMGGGAALISCCDICIATENSFFGFPAVHLGAEPAIVSAFIVKSIGRHQSKRYLLTGERFDAHRAKELGLVHAVCMKEQLSETVEGFVDHILAGGPKSLARTKEFIDHAAELPLDKHLLSEAARRTIVSRKSDEALEGLRAFQEKRSPSWVKNKNT